MKQIVVAGLAILTFASCTNTSLNKSAKETISTPTSVQLDLVNVVDDQVSVTIDPGKFTAGETVLYFPKTVPGTYSEDNYGRLIEGVKGIDYKGNEVLAKQLDVNSWQFSNAENLDKITYLVNDSYDIKGELGIFSPSGTNFEKDKNFVLNLHGVVGYFKEKQELPFNISITRPEDLFVSTALTPAVSETTTDAAIKTDNFVASRYFEVTDNPIFYSKTPAERFTIDNMDVILDVYSPNKVYSAEGLMPNIKEMMKAQKNYLGDVNSTDLYAIQLYLSDMSKNDANGFGALEHHTSTVVVFPEVIGEARLNEGMTDVVSHEFFHTLTPLNVHSEEVQYFDYNDPKMSQHLWLYEGLTEYFANHFQVHQKLIEPQDFYNRMLDKINTSMAFTDTMPFTEMSKNILLPEYEKEYLNVYNKGALIAMALDIELRDLSNGERGVLELMSRLSEKYGKDKPFIDNDLIPEIVAMTDPKIGEFFSKYVTGTTPIPYEEYFSRVGLEYGDLAKETNIFIYGNTPFLGIDEENKTINFIPMTNTMLTKLGVLPNDILLEMNGTKYNLDNVREMIQASMQLEVGKPITFKVKRGNEEKTLTAIYETPKFMAKEITEMNLPETDPRVQLRKNWLFN